MNKWIKILTKHVSYECKCKLDSRKCNLNQQWHNDKSLCGYKYPKEHHPATSTCKNGKYLETILANSVIVCDKIIKTTKTFPTKSTSTYIYILLTFLLITIALLIAVNIYCYLKKYWAKQKHLLQYHNISKKWKCIDINNWIWKWVITSWK